MVLCLSIFAIWSLVEFCNVFLIAKHFLFLERKDKSIYNIVVTSSMFILITVIDAIGIEYNIGSIVILFYFPFLLKSAVIVNQFYKMRFNTWCMIAFLMLINSCMASNIGIVVRLIGLDFSGIKLLSIIYELASSLLFLIILYLGVILKKRKNLILYIEELGIIDYVLFGIILFSSTMIELSMFDTPGHSRVGRIITMISYYSVCTLILKSILSHVKNKRLIYQNIILEDQIKQSSDYCETIVKNEIHTKKFRHDIKNLLMILYTLIKNNQNEKALNYIAELQEISNYGSVSYSSGNFIADAILTTKSADAVKNDIQIELEGLFPTDMISDVDMVIILSNILDNAIEASGRMSGKKEIQIKSILRKNNWVLIVKNPSLEVVIDGKNGIQTNKNDSNNHGIGLKNVINAVGKYDGELTLDYNDGKFTSMVKFQFSQG